MERLLIYPLHHIDPGAKLVGTAFTLVCQNEHLTMLKARPGGVLVIAV